MGSRPSVSCLLGNTLQKYKLSTKQNAKNSFFCCHTGKRITKYFRIILLYAIESADFRRELALVVDVVLLAVFNVFFKS